ncbi:glutamate--cysteine ligase [Shewanella sp. NIFS-20-20]|uniref:glutamate--cysteine ligase n=1 Tax=Shewanella sp. NIFS-20-20 TaxID=2853806 RepID=UPI001C4385DA|nr:glutamate--cysteine ligase [Shewanella sp. NIFS-20-20]MBV7316908.1 glutamate--cysteine ligase [Shewanella sp. NIFS-20-20]
MISHFRDASGRQALTSVNRGIEREALRVNANGTLASDPHPQALGSALTHSRITTDYSESLLEFITPVSQEVNRLLDGLTQTHAFTLKHLAGQQLWPVSMPCYVGDVADIPIAQYGQSNSGRMKTLYRKGLTKRYGALMQIISGVHFNFSVSDELWQRLYDQSDKTLSLQDFISDGYFGLIRNYRRMVWMLPYLFGSSPAVCESFIKPGFSGFDFKKMGRGTLYLPYATSLRMSDLGYTNKEQERLNISYNSLAEYLAGIKRAIRMPSDEFANIGIKVDGEYQQLNTNILQIENEFYSPIRAKRVTAKGETPSAALERAGVQYIEVRALDVNPFSPIGIDAKQVRWLDLFLLYCLLSSSRPSCASEEVEMSANLQTVIMGGRQPQLTLLRGEKNVLMADWLSEVFAELAPLAKLLDGDEHDDYQQALQHWSQAISDPEQTLSGQVMATLNASQLDHNIWVKQLASQYHQYFMDYPLSAASQASFEQEAIDSLAQQQAIEASDSMDFDHFLAQYFASTCRHGYLD